MKTKLKVKVKVAAPKKHLSAEARQLWKRIVEEWELDDLGLLLLEGALESLDRMRQAQRLIKKEGVIVKDRFGEDRPHPAVRIERDARATMLRNIKALGLDLEPLNGAPAGRPEGEIDPCQRNAGESDGNGAWT